MTSTLATSRNWSTGQKIAFRFFCTYFLLYLAPLNPIWFSVVPWVGRLWLKLPYEITVFPNGSGDTTFNYVQILCFLVLSTVICLVWSLVDRRRPGYNQALYWLVVLLRYYLAMMMVLYGFAKLYKSQFPSPGLYQLSQPLGQFSPMGLAWAFMGYSTGYNWFTGAVEVLGGTLLLFRRTTSLGGILLLGVIGTIVAMNFAFDIPVKLFSTHLLLMTVFILVPDAGRLVDVLILNRPTLPQDLTPFFTDKRLQIARVVVKTLVIAVLFGRYLPELLPSANSAGNLNKKPPLHGLYRVTQFRRNNDSLTMDSTRWRQVIIDGSLQRASLAVRMENDSVTWFQLEVDTLHGWATVYRDTAQKYRLHYSKPHSGSLVLRGSLAMDSVVVRLSRQADDQYQLLKRGFHWINERPFNR